MRELVARTDDEVSERERGTRVCQTRGHGRLASLLSRSRVGSAGSLESKSLPRAFASPAAGCRATCTSSRNASRNAARCRRLYPVTKNYREHRGTPARRARPESRSGLDPRLQKGAIAEPREATSARAASSSCCLTPDCICTGFRTGAGNAYFPIRDGCAVLNSALIHRSLSSDSIRELPGGFRRASTGHQESNPGVRTRTSARGGMAPGPSGVAAARPTRAGCFAKEIPPPAVTLTTLGDAGTDTVVFHLRIATRRTHVKTRSTRETTSSLVA